jgi:hypothetical protein
MASGLTAVFGDNAMTLSAAGAGTVTSGPVSAAGQAAYVIVMVHCTAATGTGPTLDVSLEESANGSSGWTAVTASAITQLTGTGNRVACAVVTKNFVRVSATVGGTGPAVTASIAVAVFAE